MRPSIASDQVLARHSVLGGNIPSANKAEIQSESEYDFHITSKSPTHSRISAVFRVNVKFWRAKSMEHTKVKADNSAFVNSRLLLLQYVFYTFEISVLACTATMSKFYGKHNVNATISTEKPTVV